MELRTRAERRGAVFGFALAAAFALLAREAPGPAPPPATPAVSPVAGDPRLDLNRAGPAELAELPGIGPVLAERIVRHRAVHGAFAAPEELLAVRGIGPKLFARLLPEVRAGAPGGADSAGAAAGAAGPGTIPGP